MLTNTLIQASSTIPLQTIPTNWLIGIIILAIWSLIWKGLALYKSAQKGQKIWFIIMLIGNTVGILEIIYLLIYREARKTPIINPLAPKHFTEPANPNLP